jgi:hypothetical protein
MKVEKYSVSVAICIHQGTVQHICSLPRALSYVICVVVQCRICPSWPMSDASAEDESDGGLEVGGDLSMPTITTLTA